MNPTIRDVAELAGVSTATVSRVLNDPTTVSERLRSRVKEAIAKLGYQPNGIAQSLKRRKTKMIGILISNIANPFFSSVVRGAEDALGEEGYKVILCNTDEDLTKEKSYIDGLLQKRVDGFIVSTTSSEGQHFEAIIKQRLPVVFVNRKPDLQNMLAVQNDNVLGATMAIEHLISLNHRRIGAILGPQNVSTGRERMLGYRKALEMHGIEYNPDLVCIGDFGYKSGYRLIADLLNVPQPPTAVFVANNLMTLGALERLYSLGIRVPDDISLVGFDYSDWMRVVRPKLTTVVQRSYELGQIAAKQLLRYQRILAAGNTFPGDTIVLEPKFVRGGSTRRI